MVYQAYKLEVFDDNKWKVAVLCIGQPSQCVHDLLTCVVKEKSNDTRIKRINEVEEFLAIVSLQIRLAYDKKYNGEKIQFKDGSICFRQDLLDNLGG